MIMSDTPRTDLEESKSFHGLCNISLAFDFARTLERELNNQYEENVARIHAQALAENERNQLKSDLASEKLNLEAIVADFRKVKEERDQLKAEVERLKDLTK
jgi:hypothetical protein